MKGQACRGPKISSCPASPPRQAAPASGIGLVLTRDIIEAQFGRLQLANRDGALRRGQGYPASQLLRRTQKRVALSRDCRRYFQIDKITIQRVSRLYELTGALGIAPALTNTGVIDQVPRLNGVFTLFS
jgi:hypothetical protein